MTMWAAASASTASDRGATYLEAAMLFACNAVDGTARARTSCGSHRGNAERFKAIVRTEIDRTRSRRDTRS